MSQNLDKKKVPQAPPPEKGKTKEDPTPSRPSGSRRGSRVRNSKATQSGKVDEAGENGPSKEIYFLIPRTVTILYGPYQWQGMMDYRTERLQGLKTFLEKLGVTVVLTPCLDHVNLCRLWFLDELVWGCKITDLMWGGDGELDPLCWEAADKLEDMVKQVLKGLRTMKGLPTVEQLKQPFCPCFQVDWGTGGGKEKKKKGRSSDALVGKEVEGKCLACSAGGGRGSGGKGKLSLKSKEEEDQRDKVKDKRKEESQD